MRQNVIVKLKRERIYMGLGKRIKHRRKTLNLTADKLGEMIGKDRSTVYRYERDDIDNVSIKVVEQIANALNVTPGFLMGWETLEESEQRLWKIKNK